jgi:hypothetical protein
LGCYLKPCFSDSDDYLPTLPPNIRVRKTLDWKKRGGNTEGAPKKDFATIPYFLEITNVGEAYLIFEKISVLPKLYSTNRPNRLKTLLKVFWQFKTRLKVFCFGKTLLKFICWACSRKTVLCFAIRLTIVITSVP